MANSMKQDLTGKRVVIKADILRPEYAPEEARTVDVLGGFGARPETMGSALFVRWPDGSKDRMEGYDVERIVGDTADFDPYPDWR